MTHKPPRTSAWFEKAGPKTCQPPIAAGCHCWLVQQCRVPGAGCHCRLVQQCRVPGATAGWCSSVECRVPLLACPAVSGGCRIVSHGTKPGPNAPKLPFDHRAQGSSQHCWTSQQWHPAQKPPRVDATSGNAGRTSVEMSKSKRAQKYTGEYTAAGGRFPGQELAG